MAGWDNKSEDEILEIHHRASNTLKERYISGELVSNFKGKTHTAETKKNNVGKSSIALFEW